MDSQSKYRQQVQDGIFYLGKHHIFHVCFSQFLMLISALRSWSRNPTDRQPTGGFGKQDPLSVLQLPAISMEREPT